MEGAKADAARKDAAYATVQTFYEELGTIAMDKGSVGEREREREREREIFIGTQPVIICLVIQTAPHKYFFVASSAITVSISS